MKCITFISTRLLRLRLGQLMSSSFVIINNTEPNELLQDKYIPLSLKDNLLPLTINQQRYNMPLMSLFVPRNQLSLFHHLHVKLRYKVASGIGISTTQLTNFLINLFRSWNCCKYIIVIIMSSFLVKWHNCRLMYSQYWHLLPEVNNVHCGKPSKINCLSMNHDIWSANEFLIRMQNSNYKSALSYSSQVNHQDGTTIYISYKRFFLLMRGQSNLLFKSFEEITNRVSPKFEFVVQMAVVVQIKVLKLINYRPFFTVTFNC